MEELEWGGAKVEEASERSLSGRGWALGGASEPHWLGLGVLLSLLNNWFLRREEVKGCLP